MKKIWIFLITLLFAVPVLAYAEAQATIRTFPENPAPYDVTTLTLVSYDFDVDNASITWMINGRQFASGVGVKKINVTAGPSGSIIPVTVKANTVAGDNIEMSINVSPQSVDLIWETPEAYVPPFYEGKSLPGEGATVKVIALPSINEAGKRVPASNLSYSWYVSGEYMENISGQGRQSANISLDYLRDQTYIKVKVRSAIGGVAEKSISISPHHVMPLFYLYDDVLGVNFSKFLNKRLETTQTVSVSLVPFYLSTNKSSVGTDSYGWFLDSLPFTSQENTLVRLQPTENSQGIKNLSVVISNTKRTLQKAQADLTILFDTRQ